MEKALPNDEPVNVILEDNESTSVPSGEVWEVRITQTSRSFDNDTGTDNYLEVNGSEAFSTRSNQGILMDNEPFVFPGGTDFDANVEESGTGFLISGWKVQDRIKNEPVLHVLENGESATVPSGETWRVSLLNLTRSLSNDTGSENSLELDGVEIFGGNDNLEISQYCTQAVVVGGQTFTARVEESGLAITISGYVVQE